MLNERTEQAAARRLAYELGLRNVELHMALPDFRYRAEKDGIVENEICPVLIGFTDQKPVVNSREVAEVEWVDWSTSIFTPAIGELVTLLVTVPCRLAMPAPCNK